MQDRRQARAGWVSSGRSAAGAAGAERRVAGTARLRAADRRWSAGCAALAVGRAGDGSRTDPVLAAGGSGYDGIVWN